MPKKLTLCFLLTLATLSLTACYNATNPNTKFKTSFGLELKYPAGWQVKEFNLDQYPNKTKFVILKRPSFALQSDPSTDGITNQPVEPYTVNYPYDGLVISYSLARPEDRKRDCHSLTKEYYASVGFLNECSLVKRNDRFYLEEVGRGGDSNKVFFTAIIGDYVLKAQASLHNNDYKDQKSLYESIVNTFKIDDLEGKKPQAELLTSFENKKGILYYNEKKSTLNFYDFEQATTKPVIKLSEYIKPFYYSDDYVYFVDTIKDQTIFNSIDAVENLDQQKLFPPEIVKTDAVRKVSLKTGEQEYVEVPRFFSLMDDLVTDTGIFAYEASPLEPNQYEIRTFDIKHSRDEAFLKDFPGEINCGDSDTNFEGYNSANQSFNYIKKANSMMCGVGLFRFQLNLSGKLTTTELSGTLKDNLRKPSYRCGGHDLIYDPIEKRLNYQNISIDGNFIGCLN